MRQGVKKTEINVSMGMIETALCIPQESKYSTHIFLRIGCEFDDFPLLSIREIVALEDKGMIEIIKEKNPDNGQN